MSGNSLLRPADALRRSQERLCEWGAASAELPLARPLRSSALLRSLALHRALSLLSRFLLRWRYAQLARKAAAAAVMLGPESLTANLAAGIAFWRSGGPTDGLSCLQRAAALDDPRQRGNWELAKLLLQLEGSDIAPEGLKLYRASRLSALRAAGASTDAGTRRRAAIALAEALHESGASSEALAVIEPVLNGAPDDMRALRAAIYNLIAQNRVSEACALRRRILAMDANEPVLQPLRALEPLCEAEVAQQQYSAGKPRPWLIAMGGGIGDILHCTPAIANIARRTGAPVDVLVLGDHGGAEFLVRNPQYVDRVWTLTPEVLQQPYHAVLVLHSFGPLRFAFKTDRVGNARDWLPFRPGRLNETIFNLEAARALFGIPYEDEDSARYFVGDLEARPSRQPLIGLHAGSKDGRWLSKRWPYFAGLAARFTARGIRVASFGMPGEYVEGSENRTGGSIEQMSRSMRDCSVFVSNDSGGMHIASALGIPVLSLFAPTDALTRLPLGARTVALALRKDCSPCEVKNHSYFASGQCRCIGEITLEAVEKELLSLLSVSHVAREAAA